MNREEEEATLRDMTKDGSTLRAWLNIILCLVCVCACVHVCVYLQGGMYTQLENTFAALGISVFVFVC